MGAKKLAELCSKLERVTEAEFDENRFQYLEKIERELDHVLDALKAISGDKFYDKMSGSIR